MYRRGAEKPATGGLERAATLAAAALGLVGYLYALGGVVVWLRVQTSQLTPDGAIIGADDRHLLAIGARVVAFELFLGIAISAIVTALFSIAILRHGRLPPEQTEKPQTLEGVWGSKQSLGGIVGPQIALLLITVGLSVNGSPGLRAALWIGGLAFGLLAGLAMVFSVKSAADVAGDNPPDDSAWQIILRDLGDALGLDGLRTMAALLFAIGLGAAIFLLPLLQGTILLAGTIMIYAGHLASWPRRNTPGSFPGELMRSTGVWSAIALSTVVALAWVATPPVAFTRAVVASANGRTSQSGAYLDRSDGGVYLGLCASRRAPGRGQPHSTQAHIRLVPAAESARLELGREHYVFDPGGRPSIWQVVAAVVGGSNAATHDAPLHHPLRGHPVRLCGSQKPRDSQAVLTGDN